MLKTYALSMFAVLSVAAPALARPWWNWGPIHHHNAPEPLTIAGLTLGAGAVGLARWMSSRKG